MALTKPSVTKQEPIQAAAEETAAMTAEGVAETATEVKQETKAEVEPTEPTKAAETAQEPEKAAESPAKQEVAQAAEAKAPTAVQAQQNAMAKFTEEQAALGFEGLEITGMSFDRIKLHEGKFLLGSDEIDLGEEFDCIIHQVRKLYVVRQSADNDAESFYSYDEAGKTFTDGTSSHDKLQEWAEDGYGTEESPLDIRPYREATVTLVNRDDEYEDQMIMMSIPPASIPRLGGHAANTAMKHGGASMNQVITHCQVGKKVGEGKKAFRPWVFKVVKRLDA